MSLQNKKLDSCKLNSPIIKKKKSKCSRKFTITFVSLQANQQAKMLPPKTKEMPFHSQLSKGLISKKLFSVHQIIIKITIDKNILTQAGLFLPLFLSSLPLIFFSFEIPFLVPLCLVHPPC